MNKILAIPSLLFAIACLPILLFGAVMLAERMGAKRIPDLLAWPFTRSWMWSILMWECKFYALIAGQLLTGPVIHVDARLAVGFQALFIMTGLVLLLNRHRLVPRSFRTI
ncbi:MAG: hypothetical protein JWM46_462 [Candidatus Kaiserbacteria bacterium]|nr:hypothetical protein [Candidatus Kaiserbacteria bacterium]